MSSRTIVAIEPSFDGGASIRLIKAPASFPGALVPRPFDCNTAPATAWSAPDAVKTYGQTIFSRLKTHPAIRSALDMALLAPHDQVRPLYFKVDVNDAERILWETLCDDQGQFLALDRRWPIARIADSVVDLPAVEPVFTPPLKILAFIAALGIDGLPEWESLRKAVDKGRKNGLPIEVKLFVGQKPVLDAVRKEIAGGLAHVEAAPLPDRVMEIEDALEAFSPHVVHFFCHGSTAHGVSELELATLLDHLQLNAAGSIRLQIDQLAGMPGMKRAWMVTLNCCEGGRPTSDLHSMAHSLVASGIPAAVGSLEPIDAGDANEFCVSFYPTVFDRLQKQLEGIPSGQTVEVEWAEALRPPRTGLCQKHQNDPGNFRQWALPVLYLRRELFRVKKADSGMDPRSLEDLEEMKTRAEMVARALRALPPATPEETRDQLLAILADLPGELRPDRYGNFPATGGSR